MKVLRIDKVATAVLCVTVALLFFKPFLTLLSQDIFKEYQLFVTLWILARKEKLHIVLKTGLVLLH